MNRITKKIVSVLLAAALVVSGISYAPGTKTVRAASTITGTGFTAEISTGTTTFSETESEGAVSYNNYVRYEASIADKSGEDSECEATKMIDNDSGTRWADASSGDDGYITVNLGAAYSISKVYVNWEVANAKRYKIQYSSDNSNWSDAVTVESSGTELSYGGNRIDKITLTNEIKAQYIKVQVLERCEKSTSDSSNYGGVSIWEMGIYGISDKAKDIVWDNNYSGCWGDWKTVFGSTDADNGVTYYNYLNYNKYRTIYASADAVTGSYAAENVFDGNADTRWAAEEHKDVHYITIDLGAEYNIAKICVSWEVAQPSVYNIETSNDGVNFDTAATVNIADDTDNSADATKNRVDKITLSETVKAQYVRIYTLKRYNDYGASIWEMGIYGSDLEKESYFTTNAFDGYASVEGNKIEAENFSSDISTGVKTNSNSNLSNGGNLGNSLSGSVAGYKIHFDRTTSKVRFSYSARSSNAAGKIKMYVDAVSGDPVASITTNATGGDNWDTYVDVTADVSVPYGDHKIYLVFEPDSGKTYVANIDYFQFDYAPETAVGTHEAENAHAYVIGAAGGVHSSQVSGSFSNGEAVGNMNTTASDNNPAYMTTYVQSSEAGVYQMKIKYATETATELRYRVDDGDWVSVEAASTGDWATVGTLDAATHMELSEGIHKIDITGAVDDGTDGAWANIDCFILQTGTYAKEAFEYRNTSLTGNKIEAEDFNASEGGIKADADTGSGQSGTGNLGGSVSGSWAQYNIYFDRKTSGINFRYSANDKAQGNIEIYVDSISDDTKVATVHTTARSGWGDYTDLSAEDVIISGGNHKIFFKFVPDSGYDYVANIDYFTFVYTPEDIEDSNDKHEAENAHTYTQGGASETAQVETNDTFSNNAAMKKLDTWATDERAYFTTYVNAKHTGKYKLKVAYATSSSTTQISYRVNGTDDSSWYELDVSGTGNWYTVNTVTTEVTLSKGINIIDISGARNTYVEGKDWEYVNLDYFQLERVVDETNLAYAKSVTAGTSQKEYPAENAVDADDDTRWAADGLDNSWYQIDLDGIYEIESVRLLFERAYPTDFEIQISRDGENWIIPRLIRNFNEEADIGEGNTIEWTSEGICLGKAAHIRIKANKVYNNYGLSIYEFEVRGNKIPAELSNAALGKDVTASSDNANPAENMVDGKDDTRWGSAKGATQWIQIDLEKEYQLDSIDLKFERAYAQYFTFKVSSDGEIWTDALVEDGWLEPGNPTGLSSEAKLGYSFHLRDETTTARYVRLEVTGLDGENCWNGLSLYEFEVWGKDISKSDYWSGWSATKYGIYPVSGLFQTTTADDGTSMGDTSLVQNDVIASGDTYEVVYEPGKELYFYINPYNYFINFDSEQVCWSSQSSGTNQWGADHSESIAKYETQTDATVKYILPENIDFGDADYVTTEIACQVWTKTDLGDNGPNDGTSPKVYIKFQLKVMKSHDIYISDTIRANGCLQVRDPEDGAAYVWQRSEDGVNWETVNEKRYDLTIIKDNGISVNVAMDLGGGKYYRVKKSGATEWSQPYRIPFYNNVQNGDFEFPAMQAKDEDGATFPFNSNGDEQQYPNGYPGLIWKTTGPGWIGGVNSNRVGHDIEIVNGRHLRVDQSGQENQFSVTLEEMYGDGTHGDQFAELNCENVGALYQDILTTPGSECYWDLDHAGRWNQNTMYVVAMSSQDAQAYTTKTQIAKIVEAANALGLSDTGASDYSSQTEITLDNDVKAYVWKVESPETCGIWEHHSGKYTVAEGESNYLTRFFFVSAGGARRNESDSPNETVGNLLDNVTFEMKQSYTIEYYVDGELQSEDTISGLSVPYDRIDIPSTINSVDLANYTLTDAQIGGTDASSFTSFYVDDTSRKMTIAYNHNNLKLYYESGTVAITKKIVGFSSVPDDYRFTFKVESEDGATTYFTKDVMGSAFTKIDKTDDTDSDSCFATISFKVSDLEQQLTAGTKYKITEVVEDPCVKVDGVLQGYLYQVDANGTKTDVSIADLSNMNISYSGTFTYSAGGNTLTVTNSYENARLLTITKKVTGNMGDTSKAFHFTLNLQMDGAAVDVSTIGSGATHTDTGTYTFDLKNEESVSFMVYDGCTATVTEDDYSSEYYTTTWDVKEEVPVGNSSDGVQASANTTHTTSVETGVINANLIVTCTNDNNDIGDVEVQGFQMNTNPEKGGVSEFNPSFRVVCRVAKNTIKRKKVVSYGVIYGDASGFDSADSLEDIMVLEEDTQRWNPKYEGIVYTHNTTEAGLYPYWTTQDEYSEDIWNYYALTVKGMNYIYDALEANLTFRAFARMEDGSIEYGNHIYTINMYEIANNLYQNQKISTKSGHEFLYNNVLNVVDTMNNRKDMCYAMLTALQGDKSSVTAEEYNLCNGVYKDMQDYAYCEGSYVNTYPRYSDFAPKRTDEETLLGKLNLATGTEYDRLFDWNYYQTGLMASGKYKGYYNKVIYAWDNSGYKDYKKR